MPYQIPVSCPVCQGNLSVTRLRCQQCGTAIEGDFEVDRLSRLSAPQRQFVISFLKCRGNIREMEKEYSISYPTVRARIDEIVSSLGEQPSNDDYAQEGTTKSRVTFRREVLEKLARGEIDSKTAHSLLERTK